MQRVSLGLGQFGGSRNDALTGLAYGSQVLVKPQAEADHAEIEEYAHGEHQPGQDVHPPTAEGTRVGVGGNDGVMVQLCQNARVRRIAQVFDGHLQDVVDLLNLLVIASMEEYR